MNWIFNFVCITLMCISSKTDINAQVLDLGKQQIELSGVHNARQLGGYRIGDKSIKDGVLLRSAKLSGMPGKDSLLLCEKYKLQRIYDFRGETEAIAAPDIVPGNAGYVPLYISFSKDEKSATFKPESEQMLIAMLLEHAENPLLQAMCTNMYDMLFFDEASQIVYRRFFADLVALNPEDGAVLWHCTQGKDRAGCASAMLLAALGADRDLIMADFSLSKSYYDSRIAQIPTKNEAQRTVINTLISANPEIFEATLDKIDAKYGSIQNYLVECIGVTPEMMETLRAMYLE